MACLNADRYMLIIIIGKFIINACLVISFLTFELDYSTADLDCGLPTKPVK